MLLGCCYPCVRTPALFYASNSSFSRVFAYPRLLVILQADLAAWEERLHQVWDGQPQDSLDLALLDTKLKYPTLDINPFLDMIKVAGCWRRKGVRVLGSWSVPVYHFRCVHFLDYSSSSHGSHGSLVLLWSLQKRLLFCTCVRDISPSSFTLLVTIAMHMYAYILGHGDGHPRGAGQRPLRDLGRALRVLLPGRQHGKYEYCIRGRSHF